MGTISTWNYNAGEYTIESNEDYELVPMWEVLGEEIGEALLCGSWRNRYSLLRDILHTARRNFRIGLEGA